MAEQHPASIELSLLAPYNQEVALISSWNNWQRQPMTKGADGWWRISAELKDGEYFYKFAVKSRSYFARDQWVEVFDPYGLSVTNDEQQRTFLFVKDGKRVWVDYQWKHDDKPLPTNDQLVIYELHVGDFSGGVGDKGSPRVKGHFRGVIEKLDYLADLGINALELMPVKEFPGKSWGYNLRSLFAVDSSYGSPVELCRLIDECHARGIRVIIDGVYNHAEADAPLAKIDYEFWFYKDNPDPKEMQWGPKYNFTHYDEKLKIFPARKYVIESIRDWVEHFHIDGIRFDATRAINSFDILREFTDVAFKKVDGRKPFFTVAEHVPEDPAICGYPKGPMVAAWHETFTKQLQAIATRHERDGEQPWDLDALEQKMNPATNGYGTGNHIVNYIGSHDQVRILKQIADASKTLGEAAFRRVKLATALLLTSPGLPMIWMGQELGAANPKTLAPQPIDWTLLDNKDNKDLQKYTAGLVKLRRNTPALCCDQFQVVLKDKERHLFVFKRWNDAGGVVVVAANLKDAPSGEFVITDAGLPDGTWHEHVFNYDATISGGILKDALGPSEVKVFLKQ
ncbi:MAG TPA: alpha-amylase family glycosyl hydrolase [Tepidisphaeraceae bacterium]|jgi:1,4-alpha-glucan branching enzyme|nr:alpha-amylase family glycosyl hydrolase [Tepidisphaeraceae bacterium]